MKKYILISFLCWLAMDSSMAQGPVLQTIVADDPDDADGFYSLGDVITLTFDVATNQSPIATKAQIDAIFTFSQNLGNDYTGVWLSPTVAQLTINNPLNHTTPTIGATTVDVLPASLLTDASGSFSAVSGSYGPLTGDFGTGAMAPFFGGNGDGFALGELLEACDSSFFVGGSGSGATFGELLEACSSTLFTGDSSGGYAVGELLEACSSSLFLGSEGSGYNENLYDNPYACRFFTSTASGQDGAATRSYSEDNGACYLLTLPIEASPLYAQKEDARGKIYWMTYTEINNEGFELQKSYDAIHWETLTWINGQGNSLQKHDYVYWDENLQSGTQYYRYIQYDFDGTSSLSNAVSLTHEEDTPTEAENTTLYLSLFPNPVSDELSIRNWSDVELDITIVVYDVLGREVIRESTNLSNQSVHRINVQELISGNYIVQIHHQNLGLIQAAKITVSR